MFRNTVHSMALEAKRKVSEIHNPFHNQLRLLCTAFHG
jgi:hypothetical protein